MRVGSLIGLKPEYEERYIILHRYTFPGVLERIRRSHIRNYSIFLREGILFSFFEYFGDNYDENMSRIGQDPVTQDWWKLIDPMQLPLEIRKEGEWWASMDEIFHWTGDSSPNEKSRRAALTTRIAGAYEANLIGSLKIAYPILFAKPVASNIQNFSVFHTAGSLYSYFEYLDEHPGTDFERLREALKVEDELDWLAMDEVFHTD